MSLEAALRTYFLADPDLLSDFGTRYYPMGSPQNPIYPAVSYQKIDAVDTTSHQGYSGLTVTRFQLTVWTKSFSQNLAVGDRVKNRVRYYSRNRDSFSRMLSGIPVDSLWIAGDVPLYVPETGEYQRIIDFFIAHSEAQP
jgi:hypothetical protein